MRNFAKMFVAVLMVSASTMVMAQKQGSDNGKQAMPNEQQCMEMKWKKVSERLMLSDKQTDKVKTLYMDYLKEMKAQRPEKPAKSVKGEKAAQGKQMSEADVKSNMKAKFARERKRIDIQEKYFEKFSKELNAHQAKYLLDSGKKVGKQGKKAGVRKGGKKGMKKGVMPSRNPRNGNCTGNGFMRGNRQCGVCPRAAMPKDTLKHRELKN